LKDIEEHKKQVKNQIIIYIHFERILRKKTAIKLKEVKELLFIKNHF
jgi:hypothetical protein